MSQAPVLKDKDKRVLSLIKFSKVQKLQMKKKRCLEIANTLLSSVISDDAHENKLDIAVCTIICSIIEFLFKNNKKYKINKLDVCLEIYGLLFGDLTEEDKKLISKNVNHIVDNNLIQKISRFDLIKKDLLGVLKFLM